MKTRTGFAKKDVFVVLGCVFFMLITLGAIDNGASEEAKRLERRSVCLKNLKHLSLAWLIYNDENEGKLINGAAGISRPNEPAWVGRDWDPNYMQGKLLSESKQKEAIKAGALWPYCRGLEVYRCPVALKGHIRTYSIVCSLNGDRSPVAGRPDSRMLCVKHRSLVRRPHTRIVFMDIGWATPGSYGVYYDKEKWWDPPPVRHEEGTTMSFADGHSEYWKWKGEETIKLGKIAIPTQLRRHVEPKTFEGKEDLQKVQKAVWRKLRYNPSMVDE
ncbi:MAG: hypothetical protein ACYS67_18110 [Planctomycetota bacterium]|jgi:prepilin-type processing-associated H-X9-DG protein